MLPCFWKEGVHHPFLFTFNEKSKQYKCRISEMLFPVMLHADVCPPGLFSLWGFPLQTQHTTCHLTQHSPRLPRPLIIQQCSVRKSERRGDISEMNNGITNWTGGLWIKQKACVCWLQRKNCFYVFTISKTGNGPSWISINTLKWLCVTGFCRWFWLCSSWCFYFTAKTRLISEFAAPATVIYLVCWRQSFHFTRPCNVWRATEPG